MGLFSDIVETGSGLLGIETQSEREARRLREKEVKLQQQALESQADATTNTLIANQALAESYRQVGLAQIEASKETATGELALAEKSLAVQSGLAMTGYDIQRLSVEKAAEAAAAGIDLNKAILAADISRQEMILKAESEAHERALAFEAENLAFNREVLEAKTSLAKAQIAADTSKASYSAGPPYVTIEAQPETDYTALLLPVLAGWLLMRWVK